MIDVINKVGTNDNQAVAMLIERRELIENPNLYYDVLSELVRYYLGQNPAVVT